MIRFFAAIGIVTAASWVGFIMLIALHRWSDKRRAPEPQHAPERDAAESTPAPAEDRASVSRPDRHQLNETLERDGYFTVAPNMVVIARRGDDGRWYVFDVAWPENYHSIEGLASDLTDGGKAILEAERAK